ncbi:hypothetical protein N177_1461 [Lutibaculum baratangense AMV1]|uniref:Uncharacterized protein n=1 Tax=Lutibaculum baratangense AMV1 TaxID=631454 RepID=V4THY3_9HYPH|nr:hypothetical protein N177_1461 [Lutibaculum baratangense AMV1]
MRVEDEDRHEHGDEEGAGEIRGSLPDRRPDRVKRLRAALEGAAEMTAQPF